MSLHNTPQSFTTNEVGGGSLPNAKTPQTVASIPKENWAERDPALTAIVDRWIDAEDRVNADALLNKLGADAATRLAQLATTAEKNPPTLQQFDRDGNRIDIINYHPSYLDLNTAAYQEYGLSALSHRAIHGWDRTPPHIIKFLASYLFVQAEFGLACPVSMTDAAARILKLFGDPAVFGSYIDGLTSTTTERLTGAMFMTEPQAGTDIAQTATKAVRCDDPAEFGYDGPGEAWLLSGRKWFASNVDSDVIITLATYPGGPENSTRGVGMFMIPKTLPNGQRNHYAINKLKDKLGTRSMPSGDVSLDRTFAIQVGTLDRGFRQMAEMLNTSRLSNAMRSSALMRRAARDAADHTRTRIIFGKALFDQPLMRATLLPLFLEAEGSLSLVAYAADCLRLSDAGAEDATPLIRILTPLAKHYVCKRARTVTGEAMEVRGGNGYIEDWDFARILRDSHLGSIWEGSSNVIALDVLRTMKKMNAHSVLAEHQKKILAGLSADTENFASITQTLTTMWEKLCAEGDQLLSWDDEDAQVVIARYADKLARAVIATQLADVANHTVAAHGDYRGLLVAEAYVADMDGYSHPTALRELNTIVDGGTLTAEEI